MNTTCQFHVRHSTLSQWCLCTAIVVALFWLVFAAAAISSRVSDSASRVSNLQRVIAFCNQRLTSAVCHLTLADLLYSADELQQNIVTFVVDLFDSLETMGTAAGESGGATSGGSVITS